MFCRGIVYPSLFFLVATFFNGDNFVVCWRGAKIILCLRSLSQISLHLFVFQTFQAVFSFGWVYWIDYCIITLNGYYRVAPSHCHCKCIQASTCTSECWFRVCIYRSLCLNFMSSLQECIASGHLNRGNINNLYLCSTVVY